jgi:hypothetical protein
LFRKGKPSYKEDNEVICTSYYSGLKPVEGGEISISLGTVNHPHVDPMHRAQNPVANSWY